ncbi:MAG: hypothetical protein AB7N65_12235 [Vicinamibacterales bacterium]
MIAFESRACGVLYNLLRSREDRRPILIPANVCESVPLTFRQAERDFSVVDIEQADLGLDRQECLDRIRRDRERVGGLLYVRPYGAEENVDAFFRAAKAIDPTLIVIDDKCLCPPDLTGRRLSAFADVSLFSTGRVKQVDAGGGGFAHLAAGVPYHRPDASAGDTCLSAASSRPVGEPRAEQGDDEILDLSAPTISWDDYVRKVEALEPAIEDHKRRLNAIYAAIIPSRVQLAARFQSWRFNILVREPERLIQRLFAAGLFASRHYAPLGRFDPVAAFPHAERLHQSIVNLFNDRYFDEPRAERAAALARDHVLAYGSPLDIVDTL